MIPKKVSSFLMLVGITTTCSFAMEDVTPENSSAELASISFSTAIHNVHLKKQREMAGNEQFVRAVMDPNHQQTQDSWAELGEWSRRQMAAAQRHPLKDITIAGVTLQAHDISEKDYCFHIHTTAITQEKARLLKEYIISQREKGGEPITLQQLNFILCPLISTSVIDPYTSGYTANLCNSGQELQVHLILKVDPRAINHTGPYDICSPAKRAIHNYLSNLEGRETIVEYLSKKVVTIRSPHHLLDETNSISSFSTKFNEVVVCGNSYTRFFKNYQDIEVLGIGLTPYWMELRPNAKPEDIQALKELGEIIPLVYYEPGVACDLSCASILREYLPQDLWRDSLKKKYPPRQYSTSLAEAKPVRLYHLPMTEFELLPSEDSGEMYQIFIEKYNHFVSCLYSDAEPPTLLQPLKEMFVSNLGLGIYMMEEHMRIRPEESDVAEYHLAELRPLLKNLLLEREPLL